MLLFVSVLIFHFSCSKDSDLLSDYVISETQELLSGKYAIADRYQLTSSSSMILDVLANDAFENGLNVRISETTQPNNGTVVISSDQTLTYTPSTNNSSETEVEDTFTYTAEAEHQDGTTISEEASVVITAADDSSRQSSGPNISPWEYCQDGNPIGGGSGYDAIVTSGDITITTGDTYLTFKTKVESASSGQIVFINSNVSLDLTSLGSTAILVPGGVTIASDRGHNGSEGALLYSNQLKFGGLGSDRPIFVTAGEDCRFTGFQMRGPYGESGNYSPLDETGKRLKFCIVSNYSNTEVDNMHGWNWPSSFVSFSRFTSNSTFFGPLQATTNQRVHHSYIHNNRQNGMGYGVDTENSDAIIYANLFQYQRHDIQGSGEATNSYEAYCNTVLPGGTHHNFDVHPRNWCNNDVYTYGLCDPPAGNRFYIHHNDFKDVGNARHDKKGNMQNIGINGIPDSYGRIEYNRFAHPYLGIWTSGGSPMYGIRQFYTTSNPNGITTLGNVVNGGN